MGRNMIELENVSYSIKEGGRERALLKNISCAFEKGKITVISGPSGSGKTTLLYAMAGLLNASGKITIDGTDLNTLSKDEKNDYRLKNMSMIFQNLNLFGFMNVEDNILVPMYLNGVRIDKQIKDKVANYLEVMNLGQIQNKPIQSLSGGEQQRVAIIRALIMQPKVVLCDEPTASLDSENVELFMEALNRIRDEDSTFVIVTHDQRVFRHGDHRITIVDGQLHENELELLNAEKLDGRSRKGKAV